jgi:small subunit ribosomal protein S5
MLEEGGIERIISIRRVMKTVAGGRRLSFTALVVAGDGAGHVGVGLGKAKEVAYAIVKGVGLARKHAMEVTLKDGTLPYQAIGKCAATKILLKPAPPGTGIVAGPTVRAIMECAGIKDVITKSLSKSDNPINVAYATIAALKKIKDMVELESLKNKEFIS